MTQTAAPPQVAPSAARRRLLIVVGMHRSGTSATTGALQCLGVALGNQLYAGHQDINPKGYFEHSGIADTNDEALLAIGSSWDDILLAPDDWHRDPALRPFASQLAKILRRETAVGGLFAVKDPRVCRLLPWWLDILAQESIEPVFLFVVRNPSEVHRSLQRRDGFSEEKSSLLWLLHYLEAELWSRGMRRAVVEFEAFLASPAEALQSAEQSLGMSFPTPVSAARQQLESFVSADLRHHRASDATQPSAETAAALALKVFRLFEAAGAHGQLPESASFDAAYAELRGLHGQIPPAALEHLRSISRMHGQVQLTVNRVFRSWSWFAGKPVRYLERICGRIV